MKISNYSLIVTLLGDRTFLSLALSLLLGGCCVQIHTNPSSDIQIWQESQDGRKTPTPYPKGAPATNQNGASLFVTSVWTSFYQASNNDQATVLRDSARVVARQVFRKEPVTYPGTTIPEDQQPYGIRQPPPKTQYRPRFSVRPCYRYTCETQSLQNQTSPENNALQNGNRGKRQKEIAWYWWNLQKN